MASYCGLKVHTFPGQPEIKKDLGGLPMRSRGDRGQQPLMVEEAADTHARNVFPCGKRFVRETPVLIPQGYCSNSCANIGDEYLYGRVWFWPNEVNAGFITSEQTHYVNVWNAHVDKSVTISAVSETNTDGTTLNYTVPFTLGIYQETIWTLTIEQEGPSTQNAYYRPTIDGTQYELHIIGSRLLWVTPEPDWAKTPRIRYEFQTAKSMNKYYVEQRRPLVVEPRRKIIVTFMVTEVEAQEVFNTFSYAHDKILAVPIYNEKMFATSLDAGLTRIVFTESHEYNWNFNNLCQHIIILDHYNRMATVEEIDNIDTTTSVELTAGLGQTFDVNYTTVYPSIPGVLRSMKWQEHTEDKFNVNCEFQEFWLSG